LCWQLAFFLFAANTCEQPRILNKLHSMQTHHDQLLQQHTPVAATAKSDDGIMARQ
jgi:hypothetical protein